MSRSATVRPAPVRPGIRRVDHRTLRFERRAEVREPASGVVSASYRGPGRFGITQLELIDQSAGGLGARTCTRIEPGMTVSICPPGASVPWRSATVARCSPDGHGGFRIGLVLHRRAAA